MGLSVWSSRRADQVAGGLEVGRLLEVFEHLPTGQTNCFSGYGSWVYLNYII